MTFPAVLRRPVHRCRSSGRKKKELVFSSPPPRTSKQSPRFFRCGPTSRDVATLARNDRPLAALFKSASPARHSKARVAPPPVAAAVRVVRAAAAPPPAEEDGAEEAPADGEVAPSGRAHERRPRPRGTRDAFKVHVLCAPRGAGAVSRISRRRNSRPTERGSQVLDKVTCPITQSLVVRPAIAEDGFTYEREAVEGRAGTQKTSWRLCEMQVLSCAAWSGPVNILSEFWRNSSPRRGRGHSAETTRGDAAAST